MNFGTVAFKLAFQLSPIVLTGGIAQAIPGGMLPIIAITEPLNAISGILGGTADVNMDDFFAHYKPLPGGTLIDNHVGEYPFANQAVAANAIISNPLVISMMMTCPVRNPFGYPIKLITITALQAVLAQHNSLGGTYIIVTPSYFYTNCVMLRMVDASHSGSQQAQNAFQLDFRRPLLTVEDAEGAENSLMSKLTGGSQVNGNPSWSGVSSTVGNTASGASPSVIPSGSNLPGTSLNPPT